MAAIFAGIGALLGGLAVWALARRGRRRMERELRHARERLEAERATREAFFDRATHELRSPLSVILGYQELLEDEAYGSFGPEGQAAVRRLGRAAHHLLHLVDGMVELGRLRSGTPALDLGPVDLGGVLSTAAQAFRTQAADRGLTPDVHLPEGLPTVRADQDRLVRILDLLLTSAVRHPAGDALTLAVTTTDDRVTLTLEPLALAVPAPASADPGDADPETLGVRLAIVDRVAALLGGALRLPVVDGRVRAARLELPLEPPGGALTG